MSLKVFHIFFIVASILISIGFAAWVWMGGATGEQMSAGLRLMGLLSGLVSLGLVVYGVCFIRKAKTIIV